MSIYGSEQHIFTIALESVAKTNNVLRDKLSKNGTNSMLGRINMSNSYINNVSNPTANKDGATKVNANNNILTKISRTGDTMQGALAISSNKISGLGDPISLQDCSTRSYVDALGMSSFTIITGIMPFAPGSEISLYSAPSNKSIDNLKICGLNLWMERSSGAGEWFISSSPGFKSLWTNFTLYSRDNFIMAHFTGVPYNINSWSRRCIIHFFQFHEIRN